MARQLDHDKAVLVAEGQPVRMEYDPSTHKLRLTLTDLDGIRREIVIDNDTPLYLYAWHIKPEHVR